MNKRHCSLTLVLLWLHHLGDASKPLLLFCVSDYYNLITPPNYADRHSQTAPEPDPAHQLLLLSLLSLHHVVGAGWGGGQRGLADCPL